MKRILLIFSLFLLISVAAVGQGLKIATYNIRYDNKGDSLNAWGYRSSVVYDMIRFYDFDVFGIQEGLYHQVEDIKKNVPEYSYIGVGRDDGKRGGEFSAIFYKKDKFNVLKSGTFWLSGTDTEKPNKGWDAALPRICTWAVFQDKKTGARFYHFNTHFDHVGVEARKRSAELILTRIKEMASDLPAILTGDFNVNQDNESHTLINNSGVLKDAIELAPIKLAPNGTFNSFNINSKTKDRIDHIFLSKNFTVKRYGILTNSYLGRYPSDHFPVMVELAFKK